MFSPHSECYVLFSTLPEENLAVASAASPNVNKGLIKEVWTAAVLPFSLLYPQREEERAGKGGAVEEAGRAEDLQKAEQQPQHSELGEHQQ